MNNSQSDPLRFSFLEALNLNSEFDGPLLTNDDLVEWTNLSGLASTYLAAVAVLSPVFEVKIGISLALYEVVEIYSALAKRLQELHVKIPKRFVQDPVKSSKTKWMTPKEINEQLLQPLLNNINDMINCSNPLADWPTVRIIERVCKPSLLSAIKLINAIIQLPLNVEELAHMGARDKRYSTFNHTRDYNDEFIEKQVSSNTRDSLVAQLRTQRDELDAIETFARLFAADSQISPIMLLGLARVVADEARHSLIGEIGLEKLGLNPFDTPIGTIGAELRSSLDPWEALAQICLIGETGNLQNIDQGSVDAKYLNEQVIANLLSTIYYDERYHIEFGTQLLLERKPKSIQSGALSLTNKFLQNRGLPSVEMSNVGRVLGE